MLTTLPSRTRGLPRPSRLSKGLALSILLLLVPNLALAVVVSYTTGIDAEIRSGGGAATSYGSLPTWGADFNTFPTQQREALLYFDIAPEVLTAFAADPLATATLELTPLNVGIPAPAYRMTVDWVSAYGNAVTWIDICAGQPLCGGADRGVQPGINAEATSNVSLDVSGSGPQATDVTADVMAWAMGAGNFGWGIVAADSNQFTLDSFETVSGTGPVLTLTYVPEPSTAMLFLLGLAGLATRRP